MVQPTMNHRDRREHVQRIVLGQGEFVGLRTTFRDGVPGQRRDLFSLVIGGAYRGHRGRTTPAGGEKDAVDAPGACTLGRMTVRRPSNADGSLR